MKHQTLRRTGSFLPLETVIEETEDDIITLHFEPKPKQFWGWKISTQRVFFCIVTGIVSIGLITAMIQQQQYNALHLLQIQRIPDKLMYQIEVPSQYEFPKQYYRYPYESTVDQFKDSELYHRLQTVAVSEQHHPVNACTLKF